MSNIAVIGVGAMGMGMALSLYESDEACARIAAYDRSQDQMRAFYQHAKRKTAAPASPAEAASEELPTTLREIILPDLHFVVLVLQNQVQCDAVCFADNDGGNSNLLNLLPKGACVIQCATVTAEWSKTAAQKFAAAGIHFVDAPMSGGPVRARNGDLTLMVSCDDPAVLEQARPVLEALGRPSSIHVIAGGAGMGSTVKMVHQLLAGVHVCVAAEALALAAVAGLDVQQVYEIVNGAAGASWMFQDRGQRMIQESDEVKSFLDIFVKDLDIVYNEARRLKSPVPLASAALQQFIAGQGLGLGRKDDSKLVQVYETVTGKKVAAAASSKKEGDQVGDIWIMEDGVKEEIVKVGREPRHHVVLQNEYVRAFRVSFPPNDTTLAHRHAEDSLYFFLVKGTDESSLNVVNHVKGSAPACDCMEFGEVRYGTHKTDKPLVHKITNRSKNQWMLCIDAEVLRPPPFSCPLPLVAEKHELVKTRDKCRVYKLTLEPGESVAVSYPFFHLTVVLCPGPVKKETGVGWTETSSLGDVAWKEPVMNMTKSNVGSETYVEFIAEWR
jgi:L-threonate 2-dehydrogenase